MITVFVVDDDSAVRGGVAVLLGREPDIEVLGASDVRTDVVARIGLAGPDVVVIGESAGIDFVRAVRWTVRNAGCLLVVAVDDDRAQLAAILSGAIGFVLMDVRGRGLADAVRATAGRMPLISPDLRERVRVQLRDGSPCLRTDALEPTEREVIATAAGGLSDEQIAQTLALASGSVRSAFAEALGKLGLPHARAHFAVPDQTTSAEGNSHE
jgi:DNA-binding NarL/FixJ family response regulator